MIDQFRYVSAEGLRNLAKHKFHAGQYTPLDLALEPFWLWCQRLLPRWISPNAVSLFGGLCALIGTIIVVFGDRTSTSPLLMNAIFVFFYQTADAVDGKQARLTGQCTPLGAVIDHCVDASLLSMIPVSIMLAVDPGFETWIVSLAMMTYATTWFVAQWGDYECSILETAGVTEAEFAIMALFAAPALFGRDVYNLDVPLTTLNLGGVLGLVAAVAFSVKILITVGQVLWRTRRPESLMTLLPIILHNLVSVLFLSSSSASVEPLLSVTVIMTNASVLSTKMVLSVVTRTPWPALHMDTVPFMCYAMWAAAGGWLPRWSLLALLAWQLAGLCILGYDTVSRSCTLLGLPFLREVPRNYKPPS